MSDSGRREHSPFRGLIGAVFLIGAAAIVLIGASNIHSIHLRRQVTQQTSEAQCKDANDCSRESLQANVRAANANEDAVDLAVWQAVLGFLGLVGVGSTVVYARAAWREAERSANVAHEALDDTRKGTAEQTDRFERQLAEAAISASAAKLTADAIPIVQGAYPFVVIEQETIERAVSNPDTGTLIRVHEGSVTFRVKNYGNTPATITAIVAHLYHVASKPKAGDVQENFIPYQSVLATKDMTEEFKITMPAIDSSAFFNIHNGTEPILFDGWINYSDVWGKNHTELFGWKWNPKLNKLILVHRRRSQDDSGENS